ncbi:putative transposase [Rhizobium sp. BK591]|nr:putative transposase [Rhizobium sp. BK591]
MKKQRFTEEHSVLKEQEAGGKATDLCRKHGISEANNWKAKYGGMEVSEAKRLRTLKGRDRADAGCGRTPRAS